MKRLLLTLFLFGATNLAWAYDFSVPMQGYSLFFNIIDEEEKVVEVTSPRDMGTNRWVGNDEPTGILEIPAEVTYQGNKYIVTSISDRAFSGCTKITGLSLPTTLTDIGAYAFNGCVGINGIVTIGEEIINIGRSAFLGCSGITEVVFNAIQCQLMGGARSSTVFANCRQLKKITFGSQVKRIPDYAFTGMSSLRFDWNLPASLEYIGEYAFAYCSSIKGAIRIPADVRSIGMYAFAQCHGATTVEIPARIERIDDRAFYQCVNVKQINVKALVPPTVGNDIFTGVNYNVVLNVPCISEDRYRRAPIWSKLRNIVATKPCTIDIVARTMNYQEGSVVGGGTYTPGDTATLMAICNAGYGFSGWSDGNTENPRRVVVVDTASYIAIMQPAEVIHEVEYIHDTIYKDGIDIIYKYYEINDMAEPISAQDEIVYNGVKRRIEVPIDKDDIVSVALYNDAGVCVSTGKPRRGYINMRRLPTGYYIIRVSTIDSEQVVRFLHVKNR